jgi:hypothetical protein
MGGGTRILGSALQRFAISRRLLPILSLSSGEKRL